MGPDLRQLRYFLVLAEEPSFTRAAARLHLTQQALSLAVKQLEQRVGIELIVRRPGRVELTPAGAALLDHAARTVAAADELEAAMRAQRNGAEGRLRVGLSMDGAGPLTAPILAALRDARPHVEVLVSALDPSRGVGPLVDGGVDVAILHGPLPEDEHVETAALFDEPRVVAVSARGELADAGELAADDLVERPVLARHPAMPATWEGFFTLVPERGGEQPRRAGEPSRSFEELLWNIGLRDLVLTLPAHFADTWAAEPFGIRYVPAPDLSHVAFVVAWRRGTSAPLVNLFRELAELVTRDLIGLIPGALLTVEGDRGDAPPA